MRVGIVVPTYPNEKRVALLPHDISEFQDEIIVEYGFGRTVGVSDGDYAVHGCQLATRAEIFSECDTIFTLKLLQPNDYELIREKQMIVGWTHPGGSGRDFMQSQAKKKDLIIVDIDNIYPSIYKGDKSIPIPFIPRNFLSKNSFYAGFSSTMHAFLTYGAYPDTSMKIAVLGNGNTAQGVFHFLSKFTDNIRMYYRKTIPEFKAEMNSFDVIINGIEMDVPGVHLISRKEIAKCKKGCFFIDAAADAGNTIEGTHYTSIADAVYEENGYYFYEVNNSPSLIYRTSSQYLSQALAKHIFKGGFARFWDLSKKCL